MDFRQIEAFVAVYRTRSFSRAGEVLYLTQPTISSHINDLEKELGIKLFDRASREVLPTGAGEVFYQSAVHLLETRETAVCSLNQYAGSITGRLEITASTVPAQYLLPKWLKDFREQFPNVGFLIQQGDSYQVTGDLQKKKYQIGLVGARLDGDRLIYTPVAEDRLVLITSKKEIIPNQNGRIPLDTLTDKPFILRENGSGTRQTFEKALKKKEIRLKNLKVIAEFNSTEAIKQAVREGLGIAVVSFLSVQDYLDMGLIHLYDIDGLALDRTLYLVTHRQQNLSPCALAFQEYILAQGLPSSQSRQGR